MHSNFTRLLILLAVVLTQVAASCVSGGAESALKPDITPKKNTSNTPATLMSPTKEKVSPTPKITFLPLGEISTVLNTTMIPLNNCDSRQVMHRDVALSKAILHTITLSEGIAVNPSGFADIPRFGQVDIGAGVESQNKVPYGTKQVFDKRLAISADPGKNIRHTIEEIELADFGELKVQSLAQTGEYSYTFVKGFTLQQETSEVLDCLTAQDDPNTNEPSSPIIAPTPTSTPFPPDVIQVEYKNLSHSYNRWGDTTSSTECRDAPCFKSGTTRSIMMLTLYSPKDTLYPQGLHGNRISFYVKVSSGNLKFKVDGKTVKEWTGEVGWTRFEWSNLVTYSPHEWDYTGEGTAWVDNIELRK